VVRREDGNIISVGDEVEFDGAGITRRGRIVGFIESGRCPRDCGAAFFDEYSFVLQMRDGSRMQLAGALAAELKTKMKSFGPTPVIEIGLV